MPLLDFKGTCLGVKEKLQYATHCAYLLEIKKDFEVFGLKDDQWHPFRKAIEYKAFLIKRKKL